MQNAPSTTSKRFVLALSLPLLLGAAARVQAQTSTAPLQVVGPNPTDFEFRADGTMIAKGTTGTGSLLSSDQGAGTRLLWYPNLAAFRAGTVSGTAWDLANIGQYSLALGYNTTASGYGSAAFGTSNTASGYAAVATGLYTTASGLESFAAGYQTSATGSNSFAIGAYSVASGNGAIAIGQAAYATGYYSTAIGNVTQVAGYSSTALGCGTTASSNYSTAVGSYNVGGGSASSPAATDPIFEVGNGVYRAPSDAFVIRRNGNATFQGVVTVAAGGDIPMYTGN